MASKNDYDSICTHLDYLPCEDDNPRHGALSKRERKLRRKISKVKHMLVRSLIEAAVLPDNNASERLLRPLKD